MFSSHCSMSARLYKYSPDSSLLFSNANAIYAYSFSIYVANTPWSSVLIETCNCGHECNATLSYVTPPVMPVHYRVFIIPSECTNKIV